MQHARRIARSVAAAAIAFASLAGNAVRAGEFTPQALEFFEKDVRPLLAAKCFECHGQGKKLEGGLRLSSRAGTLKGGESGAVVLPGKSKESPLIRAVRYEGDVQMPPDGRLTDAEVATLVHWVELGVPWPEESETPAADKPAGRNLAVVTDADRAFWSFKPVKAGVLPSVRDKEWVRSPIDTFILARLEQQGLAPAPAADKRTLLRRATFDLTGLPPTPEAMADFLVDDRPDAFTKVVDRLLASAQYGEHWGRHWLDVARYADSSGKDENTACSSAFRYRDYVVNAFNTDKPFDRFVKEQLAGDLLPAASEAERFEQLTATGFLQLGPKALAEQDKPKLLMDIVDEQIDTFSRAFLGLTVACGRCHDHKLEPVPTRDYYALAGIFRSTRAMQNLDFVSQWLETPLANQAVVDRAAAHQKRVAENQAQLDERIKQARAAVQNGWRKDLAKYLTAAGRYVAAAGVSPPGGGKENTGLAGVDAAKNATAGAATTSKGADGKAAEGQTVDAAVAELARTNQLNPLVLKRWIELLSQARASGQSPFAVWQRLADLAPEKFAEAAQSVIQAWVAEQSPDGKPPTALTKLLKEAFRGLKPKTLAEVAGHYDQLATLGDSIYHVALSKEADEELRGLLYGPKGLFTPPADARADYAAADLAAVSELETQRDALKASAPPTIPTAMAVSEGDIADAAINIRGSHLNLGDKVPRGFLQVVSLANVPAVPAGRSGRQELAEWITRPDHPLTGRVIVNRVWQWHFGEGLCRTPDNLGFTGARPTHPELLDWLTQRFVSDGWSLKRLHREILLSNTYRMSSRAGAHAAEHDPENLDWSHFNRRRLQAEEFRDALLAVSGQLDLAVGGSLFNYANREPHVTIYKGPVNYDYRRRSLYLPVVRNAMYDLFDLFDHGDALTPLGKRDQTTVAPQSLLLMNSDLVLTAADHLAERALSTAAHDAAARLRRAYELALVRTPSDAEQSRGIAFVQEFDKLLSAKQTDATQRERLVWQAFCQTLLVSNAFLTIE